VNLRLTDRVGFLWNPSADRIGLKSRSPTAQELADLLTARWASSTAGGKGLADLHAGAGGNLCFSKENARSMYGGLANWNIFWGRRESRWRCVPSPPDLYHTWDSLVSAKPTLRLPEHLAGINLRRS